MSDGNSRQVTTNQTGPHDKIPALVSRYLANPSQKPFSQHTLDAFAEAQTWLGNWKGPLILDSCCGVGESTACIASDNPDAKVIGIDKSAYRVNKHDIHFDQRGSNYLIVRADVNDFWRLAHQSGWKPEQHYVLYPNPYPKKAHVQRRWHASAAFADLLKLGGELTVRSNWAMYIEEFALALSVANIPAQWDEYHAEKPMTAFERKYWNSGQQSWQLQAKLS